MRTFKRVPLTLVRGRGAWVWDDQGKKYLDFVGGWAVDSLGHCPRVLVKALKKQAKTLIQVSNPFFLLLFGTFMLGTIRIILTSYG